MKKWKIIGKSRIKNQELKIKSIIKTLLNNRGLKTAKEIDEFLSPKLESVTVKSVGIDNSELKKAIGRIKKAVKNKEQIVVFGDYDVDGICGTAILWETLNAMGANVSPYIPHRMDEGYGLSTKGISNLKSQISNVKLIITVDNGIVANKVVEFANKNGIDVIITDHHVPSKKLPEAFAIVHTTKLCGTGVAYLLAQEIRNSKFEIRNKSKIQNNKSKTEDAHLELVALATVADLVPLLGANRTLLKFGLQQLQKTQRIGLKALFEEAGIESSKIGTYEIGHIIAPRLNAMGRLEYAMDSLRLLCTNNKERAKSLAQILGSTNRERQELTFATVEHAKEKVIHSTSSGQKSKIKSLLFVSDESYQQGIIGLVAGKLVEEFYRPSIVVSIGEKYSKASARSVAGFNIIEFIRSASEFLVDAGGHPMAAGFTVETVKLAMLEDKLSKKSEELLDEELLTRTLKIDCEIPLDFVNENLYDEIQKLSPFGMGNPEPTFISRKVSISNMRLVGRDSQHVKLEFTIHNSKFIIQGIAFGMGERFSDFHIGDKVDIVYTISEDTWLAPLSLGEVGNGNKKLQLKIKDMKQSSI